MESPGKGTEETICSPLPIKNEGESLGWLELWLRFTFFPFWPRSQGMEAKILSYSLPCTKQRRDETQQQSPGRQHTESASHPR